MELQKVVKINEFFNTSEIVEPTIDYDPGRDLIIFMQNDPIFYRKHLYPAMVDAEEATGSGEIANTKSLFPVVDRSVLQYCKKYNLPHEPEKLFPKAIRVQIVKDLCDPDQNQRPMP